MAEKKKIAVIVRDRPEEALRCGGGLTLADDIIDVFVLDQKLNKDNPQIASGLELIVDLNEQKICSNNPENGFPVLSVTDIANKLLEYDLVIPY